MQPIKILEKSVPNIIHVMKRMFTTHKFKSITYATDAAVATITLNRPKRYNAIDHHMPIEIRQAVEIANDDNSIKVKMIKKICIFKK
jgi:1,4-dihydroxy-2-naphthoyl-CoA synthase